MLRLVGLSVGYGQIPVLRDVNLRIATRDTVCIVGPNGSGKSTLANAVAGLVPLTQGDIEFDGHSLKHRTADEIALSGLAFVKEKFNTFRSLSVRENLIIGARSRSVDLDFIYNMFPVLRIKQLQSAETLSGGEQQQLALASAFISRPKMMMIDEPSLGLAPIVIDKVYEFLAHLKSTGVTLLIAEERMARVLQLADVVHVLRDGRIQASANARDGSMKAQLESAYFGFDRS